MTKKELEELNVKTGSPNLHEIAKDLGIDVNGLNKDPLIDEILAKQEKEETVETVIDKQMLDDVSDLKAELRSKADSLQAVKQARARDFAEEMENLRGLSDKAYRLADASISEAALKEVIEEIEAEL